MPIAFSPKQQRRKQSERRPSLFFSRRFHCWLLAVPKLPSATSASMCGLMAVRHCLRAALLQSTKHRGDTPQLPLPFRLLLARSLSGDAGRQDVAVLLEVP